MSTKKVEELPENSITAVDTASENGLQANTEREIERISGREEGIHRYQMLVRLAPAVLVVLAR